MTKRGADEPFDPERMRALLRKALPESTSAGANDPIDAARLYVPWRHVRALSKESALVTGIRGAGKTTWWRALQDNALRERVAGRAELGAPSYLTSARVTAGFGATSSSEFPSRRELVQLLAESVEPRDIWRTVVLWSAAKAEGGGVPQVSEWGLRTRWVATHVSESERALRQMDQALQVQGRTHLILFDALDRCANTWPDIRRLLRGLFETLVDLRELSSIRAKAFVRPDMLEHADVRTFTDASKLLNDAVPLLWTAVDLYGLFFHLLANANSPEADWFRAESQRMFGTKWREAAGDWEVPSSLRQDPVKQQSVFNAITGPFMGANHRRGWVYSWLPTHLADARRQVSPRSFLTALREALDGSEHSTATALDHHGIRAGAAKASETRRAEVAEDQPWISVALASLDGMAVPASAEEIVRRWEQHGFLSSLSASLTDDARDRPSRLEEGEKGVLRELEELGVFGRSADGRIQIPDVYRIAFGMKRRGGVPPVSKG